MSIDFESGVAKKILKLSKRDVTKSLQVAVRDTQGGKRASWAPNDRPSWWKEKFVVALPDGDEVESLKFASQSKSYWQVEAARVTLLLYEYRDVLNEESSNIENDTAAAHDVPTPDIESPKVVKIRETPCDDTVNQEPLEGESSATVTHDAPTPAIKSIKVVSTNESPRDDVACVPDEPVDSSNAQLRSRQESPDLWQRTALHGSVERHPLERANRKLTREEAEEVIAAIDAEEAEFRKNLAKEIAQLRKGCKSKQMAMKRLFETEKENIKNAHALFRMKYFPPRLLAMPVAEYAKEYDADAHQRLLKDATRRAQRVFEETEFLSNFSDYTGPAPTPYAQARREEVTATARKATRTARKQAAEFAAPTTSLRTRPQRSAAKTAATRTQAILQGSAIRGGKAKQSIRRTTRRPPLPTSVAMKTPAPARPTAPHADRQKFATLVETIRQMPNPGQVLADLQAQFEPDNQAQ